MKKYPTIPYWYQKMPTIICPICNKKSFHYESYSECYCGTVEQHGLCANCGFIVEQAYSETLKGFIDNKSGFRDSHNNYIPKNEKRHKRIRKKLNIDMKDFPVNELWMFMI